jgi:hypothetical protein
MRLSKPAIVVLLALLSVLAGGCGEKTPGTDVDASAMIREIADEAWQYTVDRSSYLRLREGLPGAEVDRYIERAASERDDG